VPGGDPTIPRTPSRHDRQCHVQRDAGPVPVGGLYTASKTAIEGFTASLEHELKVLGVRVKLVEPGYGPSTNFTANGQQRMQGLITEPYEPVAHEAFAGFRQLCAVTTATDVAEGVWDAANDTSDRLHFPAGADAVALARAG
jgi:short-subunit dehydrogenase